ncbi:MAG: hypothetical protein ACO1N8_06185 [Methylophilus sp.]
MLDYKVGEKVRLTQSIYDDGADHHPPCWIATKGEIVIVKEVREKSLAVHHEDVTDGSAFIVYVGEFCPTILS